MDNKGEFDNALDENSETTRVMANSSLSEITND